MSDAIEHWFRSKTLPWNNEIADFLDDMGFEAVEQLKFITKDHWDALFSTQKYVVQQTAEKVYTDYLNEDIDLKKCATELHLKPAPSAVQKTPAKKARHRDDGTSAMLDSLGFSVKVIKTSEQKKEEKKDRERKRRAEEQMERGAELSDDEDVMVVDMMVDNDKDEDDDDVDDRKYPALPRPIGISISHFDIYLFWFISGEPTKYDPTKSKSHKYGSKNSIAREIYERKPDKNGNHYPPRDKAYITISKKACSNHALTKLYLKKIILPAGGYDKETGECDNKIGVLWDDFKSHSTAEVKDFCQSLPFLSVDILPGGLTPCGQPLDKVINKVFKGYFRDLYDTYMLSAPLTEKGNPVAPSRQQLATWVVEAWNKIPEEMVRKSWTACGYPSEEELSFSDSRGQIVPWTEDAVRAMVKQYCGQEGLDHLEDVENGNEDDFEMIDSAFGIIDDEDEGNAQLD